MSVSETLHRLQKSYGFSYAKPLPLSQVKTVVAELGLGPEFMDFYEVMNGLYLEWFTVLPIFDRSDVKRTWDSIQRANDFTKSKHEMETASFFERFCVFAEIGAGDIAVYEKASGSIWIEEKEDLHKTSLSLLEFIERALREVREL